MRVTAVERILERLWSPADRAALAKGLPWRLQGERIARRHNQCYLEHECADESSVVKLSMSLRPQQSPKQVHALVMALMSATLLAACQPNHNPTPSPVPNPGPVPRVPAPTPSPEPNREPEQPVTPQTTAAASTHFLARTA
ncbi:MAG TPA: hypothetical protein VNY82_11055 [Steroidobacteraceae bacterium]|nr:hypothetical protein [Steroidobacteraceae bacterium]